MTLLATFLLGVFLGFFNYRSWGLLFICVFLFSFRFLQLFKAKLGLLGEEEEEQDEYLIAFLLEVHFYKRDDDHHVLFCMYRLPKGK